ncbi:hypothetical protein BC827DRAFT_1252080, partial [Russula dissimulans]
MVHLNFFVFILGLETMLDATIESSKTVSQLRRSILEEKKNDWKDVDIDRLTLYHVEIPDVKMLGQLAALAVKEKEFLRSSTPLSEIFPTNPPAKTINIVVELRNIS